MLSSMASASVRSVPSVLKMPDDLDGRRGDRFSSGYGAIARAAGDVCSISVAGSEKLSCRV